MKMSRRKVRETIFLLLFRIEFNTQEELQEQMKKTLGTKVTIVPKDNKKGRVEIEYYSQDELDRIVGLFQSIRHE